jgi:acetyl-CoA C-acetyltransferase
MMHDGLFCAIDQVAMGGGTEKYAASAGIDRDAQDDLAAKSHERAARAQKDGLFDNEIVNVEIPQRKGDPVVFSVDEGVRGETTVESLGKLRPAFDKAGNITAGNASQISDGGAAVIVASKAAAEKLGGNPLGEIVGNGQVAGPDPSLLTQPSRAIMQALERAGKSVGDIDLFELNEAFAAVGVASMKDLGITDEITNVNGGAIALGHPIGMSGTRIAHAAQRAGPPRWRHRRRRAVRSAAARATPCSSRPSESGASGPPGPGPPRRRGTWPSCRRRTPGPRPGSPGCTPR